MSKLLRGMTAGHGARTPGGGMGAGPVIDILWWLPAHFGLSN